MFHDASKTGRDATVLSMTGSCPWLEYLCASLPPAGVIPLYRLHSLGLVVPVLLQIFQVDCLSFKLVLADVYLDLLIRFAKKQKHDIHRLLSLVSRFPVNERWLLPSLKPGRVQPVLENEPSGSCMAAESSQVCVKNTKKKEDSVDYPELTVPWSGMLVPVLIHSRHYPMCPVYSLPGQSNLRTTQRFSSKLRLKSTEISKAANASGFKRVDTHHRALKYSPPRSLHTPHTYILTRTCTRTDTTKWECRWRIDFLFLGTIWRPKFQDKSRTDQ